MTAYVRYDRIDPRTTSVEWYTPPEIFDALGLRFDLDPCSPPGGLGWIPVERSYSRAEDGLAMEWRGRVWLNPPYGRQVGAWMRRLADHGNGVALVFARTDTAWWQEAIGRADALCFVTGRVRFIRGRDRIQPPGVSPAPSVLIAYGPECAAAVLRSGLGPTLLIRRHLRKRQDDRLQRAA
jgi:hypothetical protein